MWADLLLFHDPDASQRPGWWRIAKLAGLALVCVVPFLVGDSLAPPRTLGWSDKHRNVSVEVAFNRVFCGTHSRLSPSFPIAQHLEAHPELLDAELREVAVALSGSLRDYCASVVQPFLNSENSLMLEMALLLKLEPRMSLRGLGWGLQISRAVALLLFAFVLLENGASLAFAAVVLLLSLGILGHLGPMSGYSIYPFMPALLALLAALLAFSIQRRFALVGWTHVASAAIVGWTSAFAGNMRGSHLPVYLAFLALYFWAAFRLVRRSRPGLSARACLCWVATGVLAAGIGYGLFGFLFIRPLLQDASGGQAHPYHPVAHPLVLGVAAPENVLSKREGIAWDDAVGLTLARRVDPRVEYLREGYEAALLEYYFSLWRQHPREMAGIYWRKLQVAGRSMLSKLSESPIGPFAWPLAWVPNGFAFLLLYTLLLGLWVVCHARQGSALSFTMALVTLAGLLLHLECALVFPMFGMRHHSSQLFCFLVLAALAWQLPLEVSRLLLRATRDLRKAW